MIEIKELKEGIVNPTLLKIYKNEVEAGHLTFKFNSERCINVQIIK